MRSAHLVRHERGSARHGPTAVSTSADFRLAAESRTARTVTNADPDGSVIVHSLVREVGARGMAVSQSRLFRSLGACPEGWRNGDSAAPNASEVRNVVSDATRALASPAPSSPGE